MSDGPTGGSSATGGGRESAERLAADARASAEALLDWLGPRLEDVRTPGRPGTTGERARPGQSPGPCSWCPVCALVAALRGEQPELTARLAEQAAGLVALVRLLLEGHGAHHHGRHAGPPGRTPAGPAPAREDPAEAGAPTGPTTPTAPSATGVPPGPGEPRPGGDLGGDAGRPGARPTGRRSPRPSPRLRSVPLEDPDGAAPRPAPERAPAARRRPGVQHIAVRRVGTPAPPGPAEPC